MPHVPAVRVNDTNIVTAGFSALSAPFDEFSLHSLFPFDRPVELVDVLERIPTRRSADILQVADQVLDLGALSQKFLQRAG